MLHCWGVRACVYVAGRMQTLRCHLRDRSGEPPGWCCAGALCNHKLELLRSCFCFCMSYFLDSLCRSSPCPFPPPLPSLPHSSSFLFFCFFSFCSSCLSRAAARGDGVVGSSGQWAACRGAFGSSPGSRQARGVRPGTCNHAPRAGAGAGGSRANLCHATFPYSRAQADVCLPAVPGDQPRSPAPGQHWGHACPGSSWAAARGPWGCAALSPWCAMLTAGR